MGADSAHDGFSFQRDGFFFDAHGAPCMLVGSVEFRTFWNTLDTLFETPLGRKLIYAATDGEEYLLNQHPTFGFGRLFGKKRVKNLLEERWHSMGWGKHMDHTIASPVHDAFVVGIALAHAEHLRRERLELNWRQLSVDEIQVDYENKKSPMMSGIPAPPRPRGSALTTSTEECFSLGLDHRNIGFFSGQERSFFLPTHVLQYLAKELRGRKMLQSPDLLFSPPDDENGEAGFFAMANAVAHAFSQTEFPVYLRHSGDWQGLLDDRIAQRGWGRAALLESIMDNNEITSFRIESSFPALPTGLLAAMWFRGHGERPRIRVEFEDEFVVLHLQKMTVDYLVKT